MIQAKWNYGNAFLRYPVESNKIYRLTSGENDGVVFIHDLYYPFCNQMYSSTDLIFIDPPWNLGNVNSFNTKAGSHGRKKEISFNNFTNQVFNRLKEIGARTVYIEIGKQFVDNWMNNLSQLYPIIQRWDITYYNKNRTYLLRGSNRKTNIDYTEVDESKCIKIIIETEDFNVIGDFCAGQGMTGINAFRYGKPFVCSDLNPKRLAVLREKIAKTGGVWDNG